jgi:hypothetical protein
MVEVCSRSTMQLLTRGRLQDLTTETRWVGVLLLGGGGF